MTTKTIHHVNELFTYKFVETQKLIAGKVVSRSFSEIIAI